MLQGGEFELALKGRILIDEHGGECHRVAGNGSKKLAVMWKQWARE